MLQNQCVIAALSAWMLSAGAEPATTAKPSFTRIPLPTCEEMIDGLNGWQRQRPKALRVETVGKTPKGRPIPLCRVTDVDVPDHDKQIVLITACHVATELNTCSGLLRLTKWLVGEDPLAVEIRRRQIVLIMPNNNPDGLARDGGSDVYRCWNFDGVVEPDKHPEAVALQKVIDQYKPDVHVDVHGVWFSQQTMWESTGISWASGLCRSYLPDIPRLMNEAAEAAGFLITSGEQSAGQVRVTAPVPGADHHFYLRHANLNDCVYSYHTAHAIPLTFESGFEESTVVRLRRLLQIGNERWRGERYRGYPTNQVACWTSMALSAWGTTASQRRASRVELWRKLDRLSYGCAHPEPRGTMMAFVCTDPAVRKRIFTDKTLSNVVEKLGAEAHINGEAVSAFARRTPALNATQSGGSAEQTAEPIEHGMVVRLLIPYADASLTHLRLDGHEIARSDTDGYDVRRAPGTIVEVAIPPGKVHAVHVITCAYDTKTARRAGFAPSDW